MRQKNRFAAPLLLVLAVAVSTGCVSQDSRNAASSTSAVVNSARAQLERFKDTRDRVAVIESRRLARFEAALIRDEERIQVELGAMQLARHPGAKMFESLRDYAGAVAAVGAGVDTEALSTELLAQRTPLSVPSADLKSIAKRLAELGEEDKIGDRIRFLVKFAQSVEKQVKDAQNAKQQALASASAAAGGS